MRKEKKCLLGAVLLLFSTSVCAQMTPGDEDPSCVAKLGDPMESEKLLLDSRHYNQLLGVEGAVWDQIDLDDNNPSGFINPTYWQHNAGGLCRWSVSSCGYTAGAQDNWLFTQFIKKMTPSNTNHNISVVIDLLYTLSNCRKRFGCTPAIEILQFNTTGPQPRSVYTDPANYYRIKRKSGSSTLTQSLTIKVIVTPAIGGFYLAVRDRTSCIQVVQLRVYRYECARKQEGLVVFPATAAPITDNMTVTTECMPNAHPVTDMSVTCDSSGIWDGSAECVCDPGYITATDSDGNKYCKPCPEGTYRSAADPPTVCKPCPANTRTDVVAAPLCECLTGFFRNTEGLDDTCPAHQSYENAMTKCTKPPSMPLNLHNTSDTSTSLSVEWSTPAYLGERDDLYYTVEYSDPDPDNVGVMIEMVCGEGCLTDTSCTVTDLQPATTYVIRVTAHNGVSDQDAGGALARQKEITLMTAIAPPSVPLNVQPFCAVVIWERPSSPNGKITGYDVMFTFLRSPSVTIRVEGDICYYVIDITIPLGAMQIKVRAINEAGPGPYSDPIELTCRPSTTLPTPTTSEPTPSTCGTVTDTVTGPTVTSTATTTATTTVTTNAGSSTTCPTPTPPPTPDRVVETVVVPSCGAVVWMPPPGTEGLVEHYVARFFTGETWADTPVSERVLQRFLDDPDRRHAVATNPPSDCSTVLYVQIRAGDSNGMWPWSEKFVVADTELCCRPEEPTTESPTPTPTTVTATVTATTTTTATVTAPPVTSTITTTTTTTSRITQPPVTTTSFVLAPPVTSTVTTTAPPVTSTTTTTVTATSPCPTPTPTSVPGTVNMEEVEVVSCGAVGWMPPPETGGLIQHYVARFFTGGTMQTTVESERDLQRFMDNPERHFAKASNLDPNDCSRVVYAQIRAGNSVGMGPWSEKLVVANASLCCRPEAPTTETTGTIPTPSTVTSTVTAPPVTTTATTTTTTTTRISVTQPPITSTVIATTTTTAPCPTPTPTPPPVCPEPDPCPVCPTIACPIVTCPECPSCPTDSETPVITRPGTVNMEEVVVMSCGAVGWMPPAETGGLIQHYVVRFFTGETMADTPVSEKELQRYMDNPERHFAKATNLPSNCSRAMYAQIRAGNSVAMGPWSEKFVVANATLCCCTEAPTTASTPQPTCEPTTCPDPPACDSCCAECEECTCPPPVTCTPPPPCPTCAPPTVCPTCPSTTSTPTPTSSTDDPCATVERPGNARNVHAFNCSVIVWDAPEDEHCCGHELTYKVRIYSGITYESSDPSQRVLLKSSTTWVTFSAADIPSGRPLRTVIKARNSEGVHSTDWTEPVVVTDSMHCPPAAN